MQQGITRREVYEPSLTATIAGRVVELESASMDRSLPDPLGGGSLTAASGDLVTVEGPDVTEAVATPWDPASSWPPAPETPVSVEMDTGQGPVSVLGGGRVVSTAGGTSGREVTVEVADQYQTLDRTITWDGLSAGMPSVQEAQEGRFVGLQATAVTDQILRHCGWYSTPPRLGYASLSVPGQGTMWPESGRCTTSVRRSDGTGYPFWGNSPWGVAVHDVAATYGLAGAYSIKSRGRLEMTAMTTTFGGTMRLEVNMGGGVRLAWSDTTAAVWVKGATGSFTSVLSRARQDGLLYMSMEYVTDTSVRIILRSGAGQSSATVTVPAAVTTGTAVTGIIDGDARASGFQVAFPDTTGALEGWAPNAVLYPRPSGRNHLMVRPPVQGENCATLLAAQCEAECATYWIDETGVLRWWDLARLEARSVVATLTSDDDITDAGFTWPHNLSSVKARASVKWLEPARDWSWRTSVDLWQGGGQTLQPGAEPVETWITTPDDEVWLLPDLAPRRVGTHDHTDFNNGWGSWYGGVISTTGDTPDRWAQLDGSLLMTVERVTDTAFKMITTWVGSDPVVQRTPDADSASNLWKRRRDFDLPILRGKALIKLVEQLTYSTQNGPVTAPEHTIDAGWWIQSEEQAQYTADYAGARVTVPQPVLSSIGLVPIPGLQLGDTVEVRDEHVTRLTIRGVVVEDSRSIDSGMGITHAAAIRPTSVTRNGVTWEEWGAVMAGRTWATWGGQQQPKTWQDWGADPLAGEDT